MEPMSLGSRLPYNKTGVADKKVNMSYYNFITFSLPVKQRVILPFGSQNRGKIAEGGLFILVMCRFWTFIVDKQFYVPYE